MSVAKKAKADQGHQWDGVSNTSPADKRRNYGVEPRRVLHTSPA